MSLITNAYVKQNFPQWDHYAALDTAAADNDAALDNQITNAEIELSEYVTVDSSTLTDGLTRHLFHIVRYNLFMLQHADTDFEVVPMIVKDYRQTIMMLEQLRDGERPAEPNAPGTAQGNVQISAKRRRFNRWFRDNGSGTVHSSDPNTP